MQLSATPVQGVDVHSRSLLAGYDPALLHRSRVLVVGLGALGQNVVQDLALSGIGKFLLVDHDQFENHNATRSPFFPSATAVKEFGLGKAATVASRARHVSTAPRPEVMFIDSLIQEAGDAAVMWADIVVSAVDNANARAWLSERCRIHGKAIVEGGFSAADFNLSAFSGDTGDSCYRCHHPERESSASCTRYALEAEAASIIPAIQSTAAVLGGLMAEQVIQVLEGGRTAFSVRVYGNIRVPSMRISQLAVNDRCPGEHDVVPVGGALRVEEGDHQLSGIAAGIQEVYGDGEILLSEPFHIAYACVRCGRKCAVYALESKWLSNSKCVECQGMWSFSQARTPITVLSISTALACDPKSAMGQLRLSDLAITPGGCVILSRPSGRMVIPLEGQIGDIAKTAMPTN